MDLAESIVETFQRDGVVVLRAVFRPWVERLAAGVDQILLQPSPLARTYRPTDGSAPFFQDYCNWQRIESLRDFLFASPAAELAARLMRSPVARFFHDHTLVKHAGTSLVTPWHHDAPYYCVTPEQSVSFWMPLDPVPRAVALECVAGSHRWRTPGFRPTRFDGSPLYSAGEFDDIPDIDAVRGDLTIHGWAMEPGDAVAFDFRTIHGAPGNATSAARRVVSTRWVGAAARYIVRGEVGSPPFPNLALADGAPFDAPEFPVLYPR